MAATITAPHGYSIAAAAPRRATAVKARQRIAALDFAHHPALFAACAFAAGTLAARLWWAGAAWLLIGVFLAGGLAAVAAYRAPRLSVLPLAATFLLLGALATELAPPIDPQARLAALADGTRRTVEGEVVRIEPVRATQYTAFFGHKTRDEHAQRVDLRLRAADGAPLAGGLRLSIFAPVDRALPQLACGQRLRVTVAMHPEERYLDPGVWDTSAYLHEQGIGALGSAAAEQVNLLGAPGNASFGCRLHSLQQAASERIVSFAQFAPEQRLPAWLRLSAEDASMLTAMLTGDRTYLRHDTRVGFERTGCFHLLVVSGMHLAIFSTVILLLARRARMPRLAATALTIALSFAYALFTGFGQPVQRSFWMVTLFLLGRLLFRERQALQAMGLAALCLLALNPRALLGSSLQMTLLSVIAIGGIAAPLAERTFAPHLHATRNLWLLAIEPSLPPRLAQYRITLRLLLEKVQPATGRWIARTALPWLAVKLLQACELLLVSVVVELIMTMPMAVYFHRITVLALPVNFLLVPFLGLLLPAALLTFVALLASPALALVPAAATAALLHAVTTIVHTFSNMRAGDYRIPAPPAAHIAGWLALLAVAVVLMRKPRFGPMLACSALVAGAVLALAPTPIVHRAGALEVTAIDVGQGDALLLITPEGKSLLVDAGGIAGAPHGGSFDIGEDVVSPVLWSRGIRRLDAVAISHAHTDHIGGMPAVLRNFEPREIWIGNNPHSAEYDALVEEARALQIPLRRRTAGDAWGLGSVHLRALWPSAAYTPRAEPNNNDSLVLRATFGGTSALLEGDAEAPAEAGMLAAGLGHADLLKVGHHGSRSSTTPAFLAAVCPTFAAISVGRRNYYGHPRREVLNELEAEHARTFRTDMFGATTFYLDGSRVTAAPWAAGHNGILPGSESLQ